MKLCVIVSSLLLCYSTLYSQSTVSGYIITLKSDTIKGSMIQPSKRAVAKVQAHSFVEFVDSSHVPVKYLPGQILAFKVGPSFYSSITIDSKQLFAEQLTTGSATLYYHPGFELEKGRIYFFKRRDERELLMMNEGTGSPRKIGFNSGMSGDPKGESPEVPVIDKNKSFINFFTQYLSDCPGVVRKIKSEFYTSTDMKAIFEDYNKGCK